MFINFNHPTDKTHREFTQRKLNAVFQGNEFSEVCQCDECKKEAYAEANSTMMDKALNISTKMTYESLPKEAKYMIHFNNAKPSVYSDNFKKDIFG